VPVLIIGSGVAGCTAALTLADAGCEVLLLNAGDKLADGNSELAQGGIIYQAPPTPETPSDAPALEKDILVAGHNYNYNKAVNYLCEQGPICVDEVLINRAHDLCRG
jgi:Aspartate oxidase